jgi:hypothetical protein
MKIYSSIPWNKCEIKLTKWSDGVNLINILRIRFSYKSKLSSFSLVMFGFVIFGAKILNKKRASKTLMQLPAGKFILFSKFIVKNSKE